MTLPGTGIILSKGAVSHSLAESGMLKLLQKIPFLRQWPCECKRCGADIAIGLMGKKRRNEWWDELSDSCMTAGCFLEALIFPFVLAAELKPRYVKCRHCGHRQVLRLWVINDHPLPPRKDEDGGIWFG